MFEDIKSTPLFGANLVAFQFHSDTRADKIDLGLGVYKDEDGRTPVLAAVKAAEKRLLETQVSKSYLGILGDTQFSELMTELVAGTESEKSRISALQTPGGVAALSLCFQVIKRISPNTTVWLSDPSWANHLPIINQAGLKAKHFPYLDRTTGGLDFNAMCATLKSLPIGDVVLLQAGCHNPTGVEMTPQHWDVVADICLDRQLMPVVDVAYQGFGTGLEEDVYGLRKLLGVLPELMFTATCSKTFSVYRDRAGIAAAFSRSADNAERTMSIMRSVANVTYAMPADHAAAVVRIILSDTALRAVWERELSSMRARVHDLRLLLAEALRLRTNSSTFDFISTQKGMFSLLPFNDQQIDRLREEHAIYLVKGGRMNVAGLRASQIERFASAVVEVLTSD